MSRLKYVIGLVGPAGSGKDETRNILINNICSIEVQLREVVENELKRLGLPLNNITLRKQATQMREDHGKNIMIIRSINKINQFLEEYDVVIINSFKSVGEIHYIKEALSYPVYILGVKADPKTRFERLSKRGLPWDMKDIESFVWRDEVELKWGLGEALMQLDYSIINESTMKDLENKVMNFIKWINEKNGQVCI